MRSDIIMLLSCCLALLVVVASGTTISTSEFYTSETANWRAQSTGQDWINLFLAVPFLLTTASGAYRGSKISMRMWGGAVLYLAYTFAIYCFDVHFNQLFVLYCLALGISVYSSLYFLLAQNRHGNSHKSNLAEKMTGIYFIAIAVFFYGLWLAEILPAIMRGVKPESLTGAGLPTNPVHVLDLSVCLPGIFVTGLGILQQRSMARRMIPAVLVFLLLMDLTIAVLAVFMKNKGVSNDSAAAVVMGILGLCTAMLLLWNVRAAYRTAAA